MITFAKGVTSGYLPLGGVVASARVVAAPFWAEPDAPCSATAPTYSGHPTCCAAALANLDILEREGLLDRGRELEGEIAGALRPLAGHPLVGEVRAGIGALGAVALRPEALAATPDLPARVFAARPRPRRARAPAGRRRGDLAAAGRHARAGRHGGERDRRGARRGRDRARGDGRGLGGEEAPEGMRSAISFDSAR